MLKDNIKTLRESKGLSQEELAIKLHAARQTISKWERGLSVPDADMLIAMSEIFEVSVSTLLGENIPKAKMDDLKVISEKLEIVNQQLVEKRKVQRKIIQWVLISLCVIIVVVFAALLIWGSEYADWDYSDPETAVMKTALHAFEWLFIRVAPIVLVLLIAGIVWARGK